MNAELRAEVDRLLQFSPGGSPTRAMAPPNLLCSGKENDSVPELPPALAFLSPTKGRADVRRLQSTLRQKENELDLLQEDNAAKQAELMRTLQALHVAQTRAEELRRESSSLAGQLDIVREALHQSDFDADEMQSGLESLCSAQLDLDERERELDSLHAELTAAVQQLAQARSEAGSHSDQVAVLRSVLGERDTELNEQRAKVAELQCRVTALREQMEAQVAGPARVDAAAQPTPCSAFGCTRPSVGEAHCQGQVHVSQPGREARPGGAQVAGTVARTVLLTRLALVALGTVQRLLSPR